MERHNLQAEAAKRVYTTPLMDSNGEHAVNDDDLPLVKAVFETSSKSTETNRRVRRRSSFFVPVITNYGEKCLKRVEESNESLEGSEKSANEDTFDLAPFVSHRTLRKSTVEQRIQPLAGKLRRRTRFEFYFSPAPRHVRPILSAAQRAARRLSTKAVIQLRAKHVRINAEPVVIDITPRSDKIPGVIKMPDSPELSDVIGSHEPPRIVQCGTSSFQGISLEGTHGDYAKGDGSNINAEQTRETTLITAGDMNTSEARLPKQSRRKTKKSNCALDEHDEGSSQDSQLPESSAESQTGSLPLETTATIGGRPVVEEKQPSKIDVSATEVKLRDECQILEKENSNENGLQALPVASAKDKVAVWMAVDNVACSVRESDVDEPNVGKNNNSDSLDTSQTTVLNESNDAVTHRLQKWESHLVEPAARMANDETAIVAPQSQNVNEVSTLSLRKRRQSFLVANERLKTHDNRQTKRVQLSLNAARGALVVSKELPLVPVPDKTQLAPVFQKGFKPLVDTAKKKRVPKTAKAKTVVQKTLKETKSKGDETAKELKKKGRRADRIACCITLDDGDDTLVRETQATGVHQETAVVAASVTSPKLSSSREPHFGRLDYAPFSSIGNVGTNPTSQQSSEPVKHLRLRTQNRSHPHVSVKSFELPSASGPRKWATEIAASHSVDLQTLAPSCDEHSLEAARPNRSRLVGDDDNTKAAEASLNAHERRHTRRIEPLREDLLRDQWCEVLRPHSADEFVGNENAVRMVRSWIVKWKRHLENLMGKPLPSAKAKKSHKRKSLSECSGSDDDYNDDDDEVSENVLVLSGPCGCGKTALVYAIAEELQMRVVEIACNERRSAPVMRSKISGATQNYQASCFVLADSSSLKIAASALLRSFSIQNISAQLSVVLVDDVDVTFTDEENFWSALTNTCMEARTPVVLTCSDGELVERELSTKAYFVNMDRPTAYQISDYLHVPDKEEQKQEACEDYLNRCHYLSSLCFRLPRPIGEYGERDYLLAEEYPSIVERDDTPVHRNIACDYVPNLVLIDKGWREREGGVSKRRLHYFDTLKINVGGKKFTTALSSYAFPAH
ncbi:ATPase family AAA domain-containing protein 5 [Toxocara canis]|uniref:ATPase family AAA domain-containing protein 5 n=1 Tax=Toxocara canis TaxID=6265 RepID=A0A0B2VDN1_TOXCA|nr:ATPase family AAA domain-containing protein 5 [Toxocara canis]